MPFVKLCYPARIAHPYLSLHPKSHQKLSQHKRTKSSTWGYKSWGHNICYNPQYKTTPCYRSSIPYHIQPTRNAPRKHMTPALFNQSPHTAKPQDKTKSQYHKPIRYYTPHRYVTLPLCTTLRHQFLTMAGTSYYLFYPP